MLAHLIPDFQVLIFCWNMTRGLNENRLILEQLVWYSTNPLSTKPDYTESAPILF